MTLIPKFVEAECDANQKSDNAGVFSRVDDVEDRF